MNLLIYPNCGHPKETTTLLIVHICTHCDAKYKPITNKIIPNATMTTRIVKQSGVLV